MFSGKPIIGIAGGIGSGKSLVASILSEMSCLVINSDEMVRQAYKVPGVKQTIRQWWGKLVFDPIKHQNRVALTLFQGVLTVGFASHCDQNNYHGWVLRFDTTSSPINATPGGRPNEVKKLPRRPSTAPSLCPKTAACRC